MNIPDLVNINYKRLGNHGGDHNDPSSSQPDRFDIIEQAGTLSEGEKNIMKSLTRERNQKGFWESYHEGWAS